MSKPDWCPVDLWSEVIQNSSDGGMIHPITAARLALSERDKQRERDAVIADGWARLDEMRLRAGEMTAQEARTCQAVVTSIASAIRSNKTGE